jgi:hypothetical protein
VIDSLEIFAQLLPNLFCHSMIIMMRQNNYDAGEAIVLTPLNILEFSPQNQSKQIKVLECASVFLGGKKCPDS